MYFHYTVHLNGKLIVNGQGVEARIDALKTSLSMQLLPGVFKHNKALYLYLNGLLYGQENMVVNITPCSSEAESKQMEADLRKSCKTGNQVTEPVRRMIVERLAQLGHTLDSIIEEFPGASAYIRVLMMNGDSFRAIDVASVLAGVPQKDKAFLKSFFNFGDDVCQL